MRLAAFLLLVGCGSPRAAATEEPSDAATDVATPDAVQDDAHESAIRVNGVTVDDVSAIDDVVASLALLKHRPTVRIVFDETESPPSYADAVAKIHPVASIMGEILDSHYVKSFSLDAYGKRTDDYLAAFGDVVDVWEIGNEINGEWLGPTSEVVPKMTTAFERVRARGKKTALTLYWNASCFASADHEMFTWADENVPASMREGLDWVLVSYYEDDCPGTKPDWPDVFAKLAAMFPRAYVGIGECGTKNAANKQEFVERYYAMELSEKRFLGGFFWWYFAEDMVPSSKPLFSVLDGAMR